MKRYNLIWALLLVLSGGVSAQQWRSVMFPDSESITGIAMLNADTGFVVTAYGNLYKTFNRGGSWQKSTVTNGAKLESLCFLNKQTGWVCGLQGSIYNTIDGGKTWLNQSWKDTVAMFFDIQMINRDTGIVVGACPDSSNGLASLGLKTSDGGKTWTKLEAMGLAYSETYFDKASHRLSFMAMGKLNVSTDGARKWQSALTVEGTPTRTFSIFGNTGIMAGPRGACAYSADGGKTWFENKRGETEHFVSSVLVDANRGYIGGIDGIMKVTTDGGRTWQPDSLPKSFYIMDMCAAGGYVFVAGAEGNVFYKNLKK